MTFAPTVATWAKLVQPLPAHRSILKPSSLPELSIQDRLIWLEEPAVAVRLLGETGMLPCVVCVVALAVFE